jgi:hypothetical protein
VTAGSVPPVSAEVAAQLRDVVGCFADEILGHAACSPEIAIMTTRAAAEVALSAWKADRDETALVVADPEDWDRRDGAR